MSAETFVEACQAAIYKAAEVAFTWNKKPTGVVLTEGRRFAIIHAHEPRSERPSREGNPRRMGKAWSEAR